MLALLLISTVLQVAPAVPAPAGYVVGPNDVLAVTVFNQPQLTGTFVVDADGAFAYPLLGRVAAAGASIPVLEGRIRDGLANGFIRDPHVAITVQQYRSQQIFVMGEVRLPGALPFTGAMTLLEALARAGSTTDRAGAEAVILRAGAPPAPTAATGDERGAIRVDLAALQAGALAQNVPLQAGDTVLVARAETVFVSGEVERPGEVVYRPGLTVRQAIALAGGVTERGSTRRLQIMRTVDGTPQKVSVELQDAVRAGDTVIVRERFF